MLKLKFSKKAEIKLLNIYSFISKDNNEIAQEVVSKIKKTVELLQVFPFSWVDFGNNYRFIIDSKYKYKIIYKICLNEIIIVTIIKYESSWN